MKFCQQSRNKYAHKKEPFLTESVVKRLNNLHPIGVNWVVGSAVIKSNFLSYKEIKDAVNASNDPVKIGVSIDDTRTKYVTSKLDQLDPRRFYNAVSLCVSSLFRNGSYPKLRLDNVKSTTWSNINKVSASGAPYFRKKGELHNEFSSIFSSILERKFDTSVFNLPNVVYFVTQPSKSGGFKKRLVYCPPFAVTVLETYFGQTVLQHFLNNKDCSLVMGNSQLDLYNINNQYKDWYKVSGDYGSFDQTLPSLFISTAFEILRCMIDFEGNTYLENLYTDLISYNLNGLIYHPKMGFIRRKRGIASGSVFTNLVDGIVNLLVVGYCNPENQTRITDHFDLRACGDDLVLFTKNKFQCHRLTASIDSLLGMKLTFTPTSKFKLGTAKMDFLGSIWTIDGPERNIERMCLSALMVKRKWPWLRSKEELLESRIYSIFGFDHRLAWFWKRFGLRFPFVGREMYCFPETKDFLSRNKDKVEVGGYELAVDYPWKMR